MTDDNGADERLDPPPVSDAELRRCADALDIASGAGSHYEMAATLRTELGLAVIGDIPADLPTLTRAAVLSFEYFVETTGEAGHRRIQLVPRHQYGEDNDPPAVRDIDQSAVYAWRQLADAVTAPAARARLYHLLFQRGGHDAVADAHVAADAYMQAASDWTRQMDAVDDLAAATRLSRAVRDVERTQRSLELMADLATRHLDAPEPPAGIILRALGHLVGEDSCPPRVDDLVERAAGAWPDGHRRDGAFALMLQRATDEPSRAAVWERRVQAHIDHADAETTALMRSVRLQQALATAEASGIKQLRHRAAGLLQAVRGTDREMMRFTASSRRYEEEFDNLVDTLISGDTWQQALITFGTYGPVTGDVDTNRGKIENDHRIAPFASLFPVQLVTPEGLPFFSGSDEETRFDVDLVGWEQQLIEQWLRPLATALHEVPARHGLPTRQSLAAFLDSWPGVFGTGAGIADALIRYWAGDPNGSAFTVVPTIEAVARNLVLATDAGIYRLQRDQTPGQFPGLGVLLPLLAELYRLPESRGRFLSALLIHPAGMNLRNRMAHGYIGAVGSPIAAVLIHAALSLAAITAPAADEPPPDESCPPAPPGSGRQSAQEARD
jgi:hypothetical protein